MRKSKKEEERERKREDLPYYYDDDEDDVLFHEKYTTGNAQDSEKKCADGLSDFDFSFSFY